MIEEKDSIAIAKTKAVAQFGDETLKRMHTLATTPMRVSDVPAVKPTPFVGDNNIKPAGGVMTGITAPKPNP